MMSFASVTLWRMLLSFGVGMNWHWYRLHVRERGLCSLCITWYVVTIVNSDEVVVSYSSFTSSSNLQKLFNSHSTVLIWPLLWILTTSYNTDEEDEDSALMNVFMVVLHNNVGSMCCIMKEGALPPLFNWILVPHCWRNDTLASEMLGAGKMKLFVNLSNTFDWINRYACIGASNEKICIFWVVWRSPGCSTFLLGRCWSFISLCLLLFVIACLWEWVAVAFNGGLMKFRWWST